VAKEPVMKLLIVDDEKDLLAHLRLNQDKKMK